MVDARAGAKYPPRGNRFEGKVAIITGAAGNFGSVTARMMAAEGASLALVDIAEARLKEVVEEVSGTYGVPVKAFVTDITEEGAVAQMVDGVKREFSRIDCLFNNAGYQGLFAPVDMYAVDDFEKVLKINTTGVFSVLKHVSKVMVEQKAGAIVNTGSCAGLGCPTMMPAYASSKAAVVHLTKIAALDLAPSSVRVNSVSPAYIGPEDGYMWKRQVEMQAKANPTGAKEAYFSDDPEQVAQQMVASVPLRRLGTVEEVAQTVMFLLSDESSYITGVDINVSGGNVLAAPAVETLVSPGALPQARARPGRPD
eukprot:CAMPEP_0176086670 /NCGR_PEP_ID=MMETSP0120_2-20121206/43386_1 /TAXON_ID=160619 /ORGANISM="Kryptoperidinium foliaceum, Strain CCMP 1326" /LENGTH=310 /DNA_ID=CAMNT_0017420505 /DNA_START=48 /DNA_END=978 /DNA_ORIENTATION=+